MARVQFLHNPDPNEPSTITAFIHCAKCLDERPAGTTPQKWARTQSGWTSTGFQIWCTRHNINIDSISVEVK